MRVVVTGAEGFLGWHLRARLRALTEHDVIPVTRENWANLPALAVRADAVIHLAGINRGEPGEVEQGNVALAQDLAAVIGSNPSPPAVVYANSVQAGNGTAYGNGKEAASGLLAEATAAAGAFYTDVVLPNLFGEHGRPGYNSFVATFVDAIVRAAPVDVEDRGIELQHAQDAAHVLLEALDRPGGVRRAAGTQTSVTGVWETLADIFSTYRHGEIPALRTPFEADLLNTLRARLFTEQPTFPLVRRADARGALVETVRAHGSAGQTFVSTTKAGITRGQHFHLRKLERFAVVDGVAEIALRRLFSNEAVKFNVSGDEPVAIDMPTGWAHKITNVGDRPLTTVFWTNELFDQARPDTYPEEV